MGRDARGGEVMKKQAKRYPVGTLIVVDKLIFEVVRYSDDCVILSRKGSRFATTPTGLLTWSLMPSFQQHGPLAQPDRAADF